MPDKPEPILRVTLTLDDESEIFVDEGDLATAWEYCGEDFPKFIRLLKFLTKFGERPQG